MRKSFRSNLTPEKRDLHTFFLRSFVIFFTILSVGIWQKSWGQLSVTSTGTAFTQNFDGMGSSATATLPTGFVVSSGTIYSGGTTATTLAAGTTGAGVLTGVSAGGTYNFANGITASATDRSLGFLTSGGFTSPRTIMLQITNNTGSTISSLSITFDYEKYRSGTRQFDWTFFSGSDGSTWSSNTNGDQSYSADANNTTISNPPTTISKSVSITGLSIANGNSYYIRWTFTGLAGSTNSQGIGIDNFSVTASSPYVSGGNIGSPGINWVGSNQTPTAYSQPTNCTGGDYRVLNYRKVSTTSANPTDGRGQWYTTINAQSSGGNVTNTNMTGGGGAGGGFLFTNGDVCGSTGQYTNKWNFSGIGAGAVDNINNIQYVTSGGNDMGLNMSTAGRYTFVMKDVGLAASGFYVGYTTNVPVSITHNSGTQQTINTDLSVTLTATISVTPSAQEKFYVRYKTATNDFSTGSSTISSFGTITGTTVTLTIPAQSPGTTVYYYVFSSTMSQASLQALSEGDKSYALLNFADNSGSNYSCSIPSPSNVSSLASSNICVNTADVTWSLPAFYGTASNTVLIFAKQGSAITVGTPTNNVSTYTNNSSFGSGTAYQNDGSAFCVYKGDGTSVSLTNLTAGATYYFLALTVFDPTYYSSGTTINLTTPSTPNNVTAQSTTSGNGQLTVNWTNPASCFDQIMVVATDNTSVTSVPTGDGSLYTANTLYNDGTNFANLNSNEFCIYKGTVSPVVMTGLTNGVTYNIKIFTLRGTTWSSGSTTAGIPNTTAGNYYKSRATCTGTGCNWSSSSSWQVSTDGGATYNNATGSQFPNTNTDVVTIVTGTNIIVDGNAPFSLKDLTVNGTSTLYCNYPYSSANRYLNVYGNIQCDGTIGGSTDGLSFNIDGSTTQTIQGSGTFTASRIRKNSSATSPTNLIINMNVTTTYINGSTISTQLYNNAAAVFNVTLNSGKTFTCNNNGNISINDIRGASTTNKYGTFTINGTLTTDTVNVTTQGTTAGKPCNFIIGTTGIVNAQYINTANSGSATSSLTIQNGGLLKLTGLTTPWIYGATNNSYTLSSGSTVEYGGLGSQNVEPSLSYSNLTISGSGTKTISGSGITTTVGNILSLTAGSLSISSNTLALNGTITGVGTLTGSSTSNLTIGGTPGVSVGTLNFTSGSQTLNQFTINRTGLGATAAAVLGNNLTATTLTLTNGYLTVGSSQTLSIVNTGTVSSSNGDLSAGNLAGTINFVGSGTVSATGTLNFYNVTLQAGSVTGVDFGSGGTPTINGTLQINSQRFVSNNSPAYATGSLLQYNTGGSYSRNVEWGATSGRGYPYNVQLSTSGTVLNLGANGYTNVTVQCAGKLTIDAGTILQLQDGGGIQKTAPLKVLGDVNIYGTLTLASGGTGGGDIYVGGNWNRYSPGGTFNHNNRAVYFNGTASADQTITVTVAGTKESFGYLVVNNSNNYNVKLVATDVDVNGGNGGGNILELLYGGIDLNGRTLTYKSYNGGVNNFTIDATGATLTRQITSSTGTGTFAFTHSDASPQTAIISRKTGGTGAAALLSFNSGVLVTISGTAATSGVNFGNTLSTIGGTLQINPNGFVNTYPPTYATGALLKYNTGGSYLRYNEWNNTTGNPGYPYNVQISTVGTIFIPAGTANAYANTALDMAGKLTIDASCGFDMTNGGVNNMTKSLSVGGDIQIDGSLTASQTANADITIGGSWANNATFTNNNRKVTFNGTAAQSIGGSNATTFYDLTINNSAATITQAKDVTVSNTCTLSTVLAINGNTLTLNGTITGSGTLTGSTASNLTINGSTTSVGTLNFTSGAQTQTLGTLTMNRTGVTGTAALLGSGSDLTTTNLVLNNGILTSGNNLLTVTNVSGSARAATVAFTNDRDTTDLKQSFVALCDGSNNPVTDTTGTKGFKIKSVGTTEKIIPIGYSYNTAPNRISLKDELGNTADDYTITLFKGDILGTPKPRVNRIWHIKKATSASTNISMKLYFFKRTALYGSATNDELEDGFIWSDARLLHRVYANTIPNGGFTNTSGGVGGAADVIDFTPRTSYTEIYAAYTWGISPDNTYPSPPADGIRDFSGISYFSVANVYNFILPVTIVNLKAYQQGSAIKIDWTSLTENNVARYEVQRAANTLDFTAIGTQDASPAYAPEKNYSFTDLLPLNGNNYYRISAIDKDGKVIVSNIVMVTVGKGKEGISIYPNPVKGRAATIQFTNMQQGKYNVMVYSASGTKLLQKTIEHLGGSAAYQFILPQSFASGMYHVMIMGDTIKVQKNLLVE